MPDGVGAAAEHSTAKYYEKWAHHKVGTYIRISDDYIVHIGIDGKLDWEVDIPASKVVASPPQIEKELNAVYCEIVVCEASSLVGYAEDHRHQYLTMLGEAYVHWIEGDPVTAKILVVAAKRYYRERSEETSRRWYLHSATRIVSLFLAAGVLAWIGKDSVISLIGSGLFHFWLAAVAGAVGALFSVIARSGKLNFQAGAGKDLHELEAASRVCAGAISGVIVYLALSSELILGALLKNSHRAEIALLASIAAGAGERLATSIISKFDESKVVEPSAAQTEEESATHGS